MTYFTIEEVKEVDAEDGTTDIEIHLLEKNTAIAKAKAEDKKYIPKLFFNGDSPKQLLARSRYILAKKRDQWTINQQQRATILFAEYPVLERAYNHCLQFRNMYEATDKAEGIKRLEKWQEVNERLNLKKFNIAANSIEYNRDNILNFFTNRSTNASAESFNSKIKLFRLANYLRNPHFFTLSPIFG